MLAGDDRNEIGSKISRLVTTQRALMKEILRARKGITAMMPGKTDFSERNNTHIHWIQCTVYTDCVCSFACFANGKNPFHVCIQVFNLWVCVSVLCVRNWDPGGRGLFDQDRISCSQGCPWNVKINKCVMEVHAHFIMRDTLFTFRSLVEEYSFCPLVWFISETSFENNFHGSSTAWKQICLLCLCLKLAIILQICVFDYDKIQLILIIFY